MFVKEVLDRYPKARKLHIILDNLNTHFASSGFLSRLRLRVHAQTSCSRLSKSSNLLSVHSMSITLNRKIKLLGVTVMATLMVLLAFSGLAHNNGKICNHS